MFFRIVNDSAACFLWALLFLRFNEMAARGADDDTESGNNYLNVYGEPLKPCSKQGMALTGFTRTGYCVDEFDDRGSHHICIDMTSSSLNFCQVTGQPNWCSKEMPCDTVNEVSSNSNQIERSADCAIQNWCVCQWAFASYLEKAGGCGSISEIVCDSINLEAVLAYRQAASTNSKYRTALECLVTRCNLDVHNLPTSRRRS